MRLLVTLALLATAVPLSAQTTAVSSTGGRFGDDSTVGVTVPFGGKARIQGRTYRPVAIVEDSRCPPNANCIWAGRLIVEFQTGGRKRTRLQLGQPVAMPGGQLTLVRANGPAPAGTKMAPRDYVFQIRFYHR